MIITVKIKAIATGRGSASSMAEVKDTMPDLAGYLKDPVLDFLNDCWGEKDDPDIVWTVHIDSSFK